MKEKLIDTVIQALKDKGLRVTPQRCAVYANLLDRMDHPTVEQLVKELNQDFPISSQATVYSSLQALREAGLVREVLLEEGVSRYDANVLPHHHFRCRQCGKIQDVVWEAFQNINLQQLSPDVHAESYEVTVRGLCDRCKGKLSSPQF
jgi:Fur family peroxide stress response transcriptional regulator